MRVVEVPERLMPLLVSVAEHKRKALRAELAELDAFLRGQAGAPTEEAKDSKEAKDEVDEPAASAVDSAAADPDDDADTSTEHATEPAAGELERPAPLFERRGGRRPGVRAVSDDDFVAAWNAADSPAACASAIGWTLDSTKTRAARLRKAGVAVKLFGRGGPRPRIERPAPPAKTDAERARPKPSAEEWARDYPPGLVCCAGSGCTNPVVAPKVMCSLCVPGAMQRGMLKTLGRGLR